MIKTDGVILDVDGTLWDSTPIVARAWSRAIQDCGKDGFEVSADTLKQLFGKTMDAIALLMFPEESAEKRNELLEACVKYEHDFLEADECRICYDEVVDTIKKLSTKVPVCIVSNCQSGYIELFMEKTGVRSFVTDLECFGNTRKSKGENIRLVAERNHFNAPVYVGDTQGDCDAAAQAKVPFVYASYGFGSADHQDARIQKFDELLQILQVE